MTVHLEVMAPLNYWTPVKYGKEAEHLGHRLLGLVDSYFNLKHIVAVVVPGRMQDGSAGVELQEENQPLWMTILKVASYATLIIPAILLCAKWALRTIYPFHIYSRALPNDTVATDTFVNGILQKEIRIEKEQMVYVNPKLLIEEDAVVTYVNHADGFLVNFAEVMIDGNQTVIPVRAKIGTGRYAPCEESAFSILLKMIKEDGRVMNWVLGSPRQEHFKKEFFAFLLTPGEYGSRPICTLTIESPLPLLSIVKYAAENHIPIDPEIIDELFIQWAGGGNAELTELLLNLHPQAIRKTIGRPSFFSAAALHGSSKEVEILIKAMNDQHIPLIPPDVWLYKAYSNDCDFTKEEFLALREEVRQRIYQVANIFMRREFLLKLRDFGMKKNFLPPKKADLFSPNMDAIDVVSTAYGFLDDLRKEGSLLTEDEFQELDANRFEQLFDSLSNLQASNYIQRTAEQLGLNYIKVQKQTAVFKPKDKNKQTIGICIPPWKEGHIVTNELTFYQEKITPIERRASREEMLGLLDLLDHIGYQFMFDELRMLMGKNCDGKEGLYFESVTYAQIDQNAAYSKLDLLTELMAKDDHVWLKKAIAERQERCKQSERNPLDLEYEKEREKQLAIEHGFGVKRWIEVPLDGDV